MCFELTWVGGEGQLFFELGQFNFGHFLDVELWDKGDNNDGITLTPFRGKERPGPNP